MPIECPVENQACRFVLRPFRRDYMASNFSSELADHRRIDGSRVLFAGFEDWPRCHKRFNWAPANRRCGKRRLLDEVSSGNKRHIQLRHIYAGVSPVNSASETSM